MRDRLTPPRAGLHGAAHRRQSLQLRRGDLPLFTPGQMELAAPPHVGPASKAVPSFRFDANAP